MLFSIAVVSCGDGDGKDSISVSEGEVASAEMRLVFADYFGDPPATSPRGAKLIAKAPLPAGNWVIDIGYGPDNDGWGNNEYQLYRNDMENVFTENGYLVLRAKCDTAPNCGDKDGSITSGKILSKDRIDVKYGNVRARIKMPSGAGMWPAFWTLGSDIDDRPWPDAGEIDIVEMHYFFSDNRTTHFSTHWAGPRFTDEADRPDCSAFQAAISADEEERCATETKTFKVEDGYDKPLTDDFHVYELDWNENTIVGKIDGITYFTQAIDGATMEEFMKDHFMILNVAVGGTLGNGQGVIFPPGEISTDWTNPDQTDMLVDWVEVRERVPATSGTLIDETDVNLGYNRILNTAEFQGAFVKSDLKSEAVTALVGDKVMEVTYSTTLSENGGGVAATSGGAVFLFNGSDFSDYDNFVFSLDTSAFPGFEDLTIRLEDINGKRVFVPVSDVMVLANSGNWTTYSIPLAEFAGVDVKNITQIGFYNPSDVTIVVDGNGDAVFNLIAGTLYVDDIRFTRSTEECVAASSINFDQLDYNPATNAATINVADPCAANSTALVEIENDTDSIFVGVRLDAAGNGQSLFEVTGGNSVCTTGDYPKNFDLLNYLPLSGQLMATYNRSQNARGGASSAFATAGVDDVNAPIVQAPAQRSYFYATDTNANPLSFFPDSGDSSSFSYSVFGSGSQLDGAFVDTTFNPVFQVVSGPDYGGEVSQIALINIIDGFAADEETINFKFKNQGSPNEAIQIQIGDLDGASTTVIVSLADTDLSTSIGDGWYEISVPLTSFPGFAGANFMAFTSADPAPAIGNTIAFLITDIHLAVPQSKVPAECATIILPPVAGSGTGATGATGGPFSVSFDDSAVTYGFTGFGAPDTITALGADPVDATNLVALTTKPAGAADFAGVTVQPVPSITYPLTATDNELTIRIYAPGPGLTVLMKLEDSAISANFAEATAMTTVDTGWETLTFSFTSPPAFTYDKLTLFFGFGTVGDGTVYTWDSIEFLGGGGGPQLAINGDIEAGNGDLSGWTQTPNAGSITAVNDQDSGSTWAVNVSAVPANASALSLDGLGIGTVQPGDTLDVSFDMCAVAADGGEIAVALLSEKGPGNGADRVELVRTATPADVWTRYNYSTTAGVDVTGGVSLQFDVICGGASTCVANAYFDNVSITLGGGPVAGSSTGASCAAPVAPGVTLPIDFEAGPYVFSDFNGGQASVEANPQSGGINVSANVGKMLKFADADFGGSTFDLEGTLTVPANSTLTMNVWSSRVVPVLFKLEGGPAGEVTASHSGGSVWEELTFDFSAITTGDHTGITFIFDNGVVGEAATDPGNWTFYFDDINFAAGPPSPDFTIFEDAFATGWTTFVDGAATSTVVTDSDPTYGEVIELTTPGSAVVGITSRAASGGDDSTIDTSVFAVLEFDLKMVTAPTSGTDVWRLKAENPPLEIGIVTPVLDTWVHYSIPIGDLGTPNALDILLLFPDYALNAGAVYRLDNVKLLEEAPPPPAADFTIFEDAFATGWTGFVDGAATSTVVTDSDPTYGEVIELTTPGSAVVGITSRAASGGDDSTIDTSVFAVLEFDLKMVTAPTSGTDVWRLKAENPPLEIGIDTPVLDTWVHYSIPIGNLGTPNALDILLLFPDYALNAGAVYRLDNVMLLVDGGGGGGPLVSGDELAVNGDFETGDFSDWTQFLNSGVQAISTDTPDASSSSAALSGNTAVGAGGTTEIKQANVGAGSLALGDVLRIQFDVKGTFGTGGQLNVLSFTELGTGGGTLNNNTVISSDLTAWTHFDYNITLAGGNAEGGYSLAFNAVCGAVAGCFSDVIIDNVSIIFQ